MDANTKRNDKINELTNELNNSDITKSREPSTFWVNVNITASVFSNGKVAFKTGIIFMKKISKKRTTEQITDATIFTIVL